MPWTVCLPLFCKIWTDWEARDGQVQYKTHPGCVETCFHNNVTQQELYFPTGANGDDAQPAPMPFGQSIEAFQMYDE